MPLHDWKPVPSGLFHDFHQSWCIRIKDALNAGLLPGGTIALVEQRSGPVEGDVLAVETREPTSRWETGNGGGGTLVQELPAGTVIQRSDRAFYARKANRIVVRHHLGRVIAVIEIVSPGNKDGRAALRRFVEKTIDYLEQGVHVLVVDLFPPTSRDPQGIHKLILDDYTDEVSFTLPLRKDRTLASYERAMDLIAHVEPVGVGEPLPDMPLFLTGDRSPNLHVMVPLESTYQATWEATPEELRTVVETGKVPEPDREA